jgi:hypothetical protein
MIKNKILDYVSNSPYNTNRAVLEGMLDNLEGTGGGSGGGSGGEFDLVQDSTQFVANVGDYLFLGNDGLKSVKIATCGDIGESAFMGCSRLESVTINERKTYSSYNLRVGEMAFMDCAALRNVELYGVNGIHDNAFRNCKALESVRIQGKQASTSASSIEIGCSAFRGCESIVNMELYAYLLDEHCFAECISLETFSCGGIVNVGQQAFLKCTSLSKVSLSQAGRNSNGVIEDEAFLQCSNLTALILRGEPMWQMSLTAIIGTKIATAEGVPTGEGFIYVPSALYEDYVANFVMQIVGFGQDEATAEYIARAVLRKIEDYPEIAGG